MSDSEELDPEIDETDFEEACTETTSLLMKELDELRTASSPSTIVAAGGVAGGGGAAALANYYRSNNGATPGGHKSEQKAADSANLGKNDSHSVARAILQAVRARRKDKAVSVPNFSTKKGNQFHQSSSSAANSHQQQQHPILNGNATEEEIQLANQAPSTRSPLLSKSNRLTKRFQLELKPQIFSGSRLRDKKFGLNRAPSLETAQQRSSEGQGAGSAGVTPSKESKEENEHGLIAYKSALLQVTDQKESPAAESPPSPNNPDMPSQVQVNLRQKHNFQPASADSSPRPGPSRRIVGPRPHSVDPAMHESCHPTTSTNSSAVQDSISIQDDEYASNAPNDHTITSAHFSAMADAGVAMPACCAVCSPATESFLKFRNRFCTSYRLKVSVLRNPVDVCLLPNDCLAIADYDNGFIVLNPGGDVVKHVVPGPDGKNACGIACSAVDSEFRLLVLAYKDGNWSINVYDWTFDLLESFPCPQDPQIETWALRKIVLAPPIGGCVVQEDPESGEPVVQGPTCALYLMASGETKSTIWSFDFVFREWKMVVSENSRRGAYNDLSIKYDPTLKETHFLLCDWKKAQLGTVVVNDRLELVDNQTIKIRRVKGQEWIVQGPKLSVWDENSDILVYDGSGKLFLFDGDTYKCKKIVGDIGRGEISALVVKDGWCYALCRYRLCIEVFLYNELAETSL